MMDDDPPRRHEFGFDDPDNDEFGDVPIAYSLTTPDDAKLRGVFPSEDTLREYLQGIDPRSPWLYVVDGAGGIEVWATDYSSPSEADAGAEEGGADTWGDGGGDGWE